MSRVLNIDTTSTTALVNIAENGVVLFEELNHSQKEHAAFLHPAITTVLKGAGITILSIDAVAVSHGPGSYTGIRVGVAAAKGLCYAAEKPFITVSQLEIIAKDAINNTTSNYGVYCAMTDARRMEVFTAVYDESLHELVPPCAMILHHHSFQDFLSAGKVLFCGSGVEKWQQLCTNRNAHFYGAVNTGKAFAQLSAKRYNEQQFSDLAYTTPLYLKDFQHIKH